jgi:hypothetical protein
VLKLKSTIVNRAPVMTAWATIVAERVGFCREEALSIGMVRSFNVSSPKLSHAMLSICVHRVECCGKGSFDRHISVGKGSWHGGYERRCSALR